MLRTDDDQSRFDPASDVPTRLHAPLDPRRLDVEGKQLAVARLLGEAKCDGLLLTQPANARWLTSGRWPGSVPLGRDEAPLLYANATQRWLVCSSADSPRFFDEDLDGLGFQLKEWHWSSSRSQLIADLIFGRAVACDTESRDCKPLGPLLEAERRVLSPYERDRFLELGAAVAHAVEATARSVEPGETEHEVAGHLAHRLLRHGVEPAAVQAASGGRHVRHGRFLPSDARVGSLVVIRATGAKFGLHAAAARAVCFGPPPADVRADFDEAIRLGAVYLLASKPGEAASAWARAGQAYLKNSPHRHDWRLSPAAYLTGRDAADGLLKPSGLEKFRPGWGVVWQPRAGAGTACETYLLTDDGWRRATAGSDWPVRRVRLSGESSEWSDLLVRDPA